MHWVGEARRIFVNASLAPVLYCHPERFVRLLQDAADGVYFGKMNYLEKTYLKGMGRAKAYFRSSDYDSLVEKLKVCLEEAGLKK